MLLKSFKFWMVSIATSKLASLFPLIIWRSQRNSLSFSGRFGSNSQSSSMEGESHPSKFSPCCGEGWTEQAPVSPLPVPCTPRFSTVPAIQRPVPAKGPGDCSPQELWPLGSQNMLLACFLPSEVFVICSDTPAVGFSGGHLGLVLLAAGQVTLPVPWVQLRILTPKPF